MVEFKASIADPESGKTYPLEVTGAHANSMINKKIGDVIDGIFVKLPGYKLTITGGTDKDGFPLRKDLPGGHRAKLLVAKSSGFHPLHKGVRKRKTMRGNAITSDTVQINLKVTTWGMKKVEDLIGNTTKQSK